MAASESCTATDSMLHHRASHARAVERRSRGETVRLRHSANSRMSQQQVSLQRPPTSHARTISWHLCDRRSSGYFACLRSSASAMATPSNPAARDRASPVAWSGETTVASQARGIPCRIGKFFAKSYPLRDQRQQEEVPVTLPLQQQDRFPLPI